METPCTASVPHGDLATEPAAYFNVQTADVAAGTGISPCAVCLTDSFHRAVQRVAFITRVSYDTANSVTTTTGRRHRLPAPMLHVSHCTASLLP